MKGIKISIFEINQLAKKGHTKAQLKKELILINNMIQEHIELKKVYLKA